jgi:hypothetical protein
MVKNSAYLQILINEKHRARIKWLHPLALRPGFGMPDAIMAKNMYPESA